ncbi:site-specific DNA-methyltransferase [Clostridium tetani]|uniref:site-specific DNA-methyltransferase n=1 Tax=Clostridium tetani TaxID=1513 RepID=UPI002955307D|nr:site-specific DNA-methyltransferase [Clostridium tetani]
MDGYSLNIVKENVTKLKEIFPEVFCEDKVDFERLQEVLGEYIEDKEERYRFEWHGKSKAIRIAQTPSRGTLRPCKDKEESKNWDTTENLYIEGDNLEVLKLLQKSYQNKIKMIYIDPPYNTGNDFVYKDDYKDNLKNYLEITGQVDEEGNKTSTNSESGGRYHTNWLNMMYPRLRLARNLLKDDGIIFISIANQEIDNLKKVCNEIFGDINCLGIIDWESKTKCQNTKTAKYQLQNKQEYILVYKKSSLRYEFSLKVTEHREYPDIDENGQEYRLEQIGEMSSSGIRGRNSMIFSIDGIYPKEGNQWKYGIDTINKFRERGDLLIKNGKAYFRIRKFDEEDKMEPFWSFISKEIGTAETSKAELKTIIGEHGFETIKPVDLINKLIFHACFNYKNSIIMDFFSGSSTTAHATMKLNAEDNGNRKFIMVQLPEPTDEKSEAFKAGYKNICEIGKERIRRAGDKIVEENKDKEGIEDLDTGFKVFKLDSSNIKPWNPDYNNIELTFDDIVDNFVEGRTEEDVVYEIMLKYGIDLTYPIEVREISGKKVFSVGFGALIICLDNEITLDVVNSIVDLKNELNPETTRIVFKDNGFKTDSVKTNAIEILKRNNINENEIMSI